MIQKIKTGTHLSLILGFSRKGLQDRTGEGGGSMGDRIVTGNARLQGY